ncbi:MAG: hypothetical protein WD670_06315, partial [Actinomycetota bacterium]
METLVPHVLLGERYELLQRLADDGRCSEWRATDHVLDRTVTVRVFLGDAGGLATDPARRASHISHPSILAIFDVGAAAEGSFVVTESEPGPSLSSTVARSGPLHSARAARAIGEVTEACRAALAAGVTVPVVDAHHVWLDPDGHAKVGLGLESTPALPAAEHEHVRALGSMLYLAMTGSPPADDDPRTPRAHDPRIPRDLERVTMRALGLTEDPDAEAFEDLDAFASALARATRAAPGPEPAPEPAPHHSIFRSWMLVPLTLVLLTATILAGGLALGKLELGGPLGVRPAVPAPVTPEPRSGGGGGRDDA